MLWTINDNERRDYEHASAKGDVIRAHEIALRAARLYENREDLKQAGIWLHALLMSSYHQGRYNEAAIEAERSAELQPDPYERASALLCLSSMGLFTSDCNTAFNALGRAEEIARYFPGQWELTARLRAGRGTALLSTGNFDQAVIEYEEAVKVYLKTGHFQQAVQILNNLGFICGKKLQFEQAEKHLVYALKLIEKNPHLHIQAGLYDSLGHICTITSRYTEAERLLNKSIELFQVFSDTAQVATSLLHLSELHHRMRQHDTACSEAQRALVLATEINSQPLCIEARNQLSVIESDTSKFSNKPSLFHGLLYLSSKMQSVVAQLKRIAPTDEVVLLLGETGTGKELLARALHLESKRRAGPLIAFNCSAISRELVESRLFGHLKGAFTGADKDQPGVIRAACGGTLFLDEIGDLSLEAQGALLRFLQSGEIQPVGSSRPMKVDVRVVAATNRDIRQEVEAGRFRKDLYYRLNVASIWVPPLSFRREDLRLLVRHFAARYSAHYGVPEIMLSEDETRMLVERDWPGNVRELENYIKRRILFGPEASWPAGPLDDEMLTGGRKGDKQAWRSLSESEKLERLMRALESNSGNVTATAKQLGISRRAVQKIRGRMKSNEM